MKRILLFLALLLTLVPAAVSAQSVQGNGSFSLTLQGYTLQGQLTNPIIHSDESVSMTMSLEDNLQTSIGAVPITGNGQWSGTVNGTTVAGIIQDVSGSIEACYFIFFCGYANYVGSGTWTGTLSTNQGSGTFDGFITFTSSSIPQITLNQPIPISGNWASNFQLSS